MPPLTLKEYDAIAQKAARTVSVGTSTEKDDEDAAEARLQAKLNRSMKRSEPHAAVARRAAVLDIVAGYTHNAGAFDRLVSEYDSKLLHRLAARDKVPTRTPLEDAPTSIVRFQYPKTQQQINEMIFSSHRRLEDTVRVATERFDRALDGSFRTAARKMEAVLEEMRTVSTSSAARTQKQPEKNILKSARAKAQHDVEARIQKRAIALRKAHENNILA